MYDETKSGLNDIVWVSWCAITTVGCHQRVVETRTFMTDCDIKNMFLNFMLEPSLRTYTGVDLSSIFPEENNGSLKGCWKRMMIVFL